MYFQFIVHNSSFNLAAQRPAVGFIDWLGLAMELTASQRTIQIQMATTFHPVAIRGPARSSSSWSRWPSKKFSVMNT